ncbi:MAG: hypothetical protein AB8G99_11830 [Planctomycetaceae bacterium]
MPIRQLGVLVPGIVVFAFLNSQATAQSEFHAADKQRLANVDIGLQHHFRRFNYEPSQTDPLSALNAFFVPHALPESQVSEFEIRHAKAMRAKLVESQRLFRQARDADFSKMLDGEALRKWNRALELFKPHNAAHLKDVRELQAAFDSNCGPAVAPKRLFLGVVELLAKFGKTEAEKAALSTIQKQTKRDFDLAKDTIRKRAFLEIKGTIERLLYSKYEWPLACEEQRQHFNAVAVAKMVAALPPERQAAATSFVKTYGDFEQRAHARNRVLSDEVMKLDAKGARLLPVNLLTTEYDPFNHVFANGTKVRSQISKTHYKHLAVKRKRDRDYSVSYIAEHLSEEHGDNFKSVMTVLDDYFVRRDAIWKPFLDTANIKTGSSHVRTPEFDYQLATIATAVGVSREERTALRNLDREIAAEHRTIKSTTLKSRGWKLFYRKITDTRPETVAFMEDQQRVTMASTILRERQSFERAAKIVSPGTREKLRKLGQLYIKSAEQFRLLLRDRISKVEALIGTNAIRGVDLPADRRKPEPVQLKLDVKSAP